MKTSGRAACAALLILVSVSCARVPPPPYPLAFAIDAASPRLLVTSEEVAVPATLINAGDRAWDPTRIHLSYHWLWIVPRELARRSRTVPYHDGIRTDLTDLVPPGARLTVQGRILAPSWPGVYWLQWDMVEEGVTWFAQVAPRQPRTLVVVIPPIAYMLAPLPLLVLLLALFDKKRWGDADVVWCVITLIVKPLILAHVALLEPADVAYWLILVFALLPQILWVVLPRRVRPWVNVFIGIFCSTLILGDVIYYRFFGDVLSAPAMLAAHQTGHVWGSVGSLFTPGLLWLIVDWPFAIWLAVDMSRQPREQKSIGWRFSTVFTEAATLAVAALSLSIPRALTSTPLDQMFRARSVVERLGPFGYHAYDTWNYVRGNWLRQPATPAQIDEAAAWLRERAPLRAAGPSFGAVRGKNLIVVQVESLQDFVVDFAVGGQEVMPNLRRWTADSLRFTNVTDQTSEGRTSDAEFTTMASLLPLDHGAVAFRFPGNHYTALPKVLTEHGYATVSAVAFEPGFWNRQVMHPSYGFQQSLFEPDFQMTEQIGWGLNDHDFLQQMVPRIEKLPRPFAAWLITLSLHHPFESFPDAHKVLKLGALEGTSLGNYLHTMRFFDQALEDFRTALARDGLLDDSLIVVFGDHDAGFARDASLARTIHIGTDAASWALNDRIPLFVRAGGSGGSGGVVDLTGVRGMPAGQTDLAPTVLSLLGIDAAPLPYLGRNLLGADADRPVPRPYGDWLDSRHLFLAGAADTACYDLGRRLAGPASSCAAEDELARRAREVSRLIVLEDLQQTLRARLAAGANP